MIPISNNTILTTDTVEEQSFHNDVAERIVLGSMLLDPETIPTVKAILDSSQFYSSQNKVICSAIYELEENKDYVDFSTVIAKTVGELNKPADWSNYILALEDAVFDPSSVATSAKLVLDCYYARETAKGMDDRKHRYASGEYASSDEYIEDTQNYLLKMSLERKSNKDMPLKEQCAELIEVLKSKASGNRNIGLKTGYTGLDRYIGGLRDSELIVIAARPSVGKTAFVVNIAKNILMSNQPQGIGIFTLEMQSSLILERLLSCMSGVPLWKIRNGNLTPEDFNDITACTAAISDKCIKIDDTSSMTINKIRSKAIRWKNELDYEAQHTSDSKRRLALIIVDYIQLIHGTANKNTNRVNEVAEISRGLKVLSKELNVPVIALSQLSRGIEMREGKNANTPRLSDLRDSGAIEQDADVVMFLQRRVCGVNDEPICNAKLTIAKNRNGATGIVDLLFHKESATFINKPITPQPPMKGNEEDE